MCVVWSLSFKNFNKNNNNTKRNTGSEVTSAHFCPTSFLLSLYEAIVDGQCRVVVAVVVVDVL